jgi:hypothetical protein
MSKVLVLFVIACVAPLARAGDVCPVNLINGVSNSNTIEVTFRNVSKLPIRQIEFLCKAVDPQADKAGHAHCREENASFMPDKEYITRYEMWGGIRGVVLVSVKSVTFSDGQAWKPSAHDNCPKLKIVFPDQGRGRTKLP